MRIPVKMKFAALAVICAATMAACGGGPPMAMADLAAYPGSSELKPGESKIAETLKKNMEMDTQLRQAIGTGGKTEQKGFKLPSDASWDKVKSFYADKLKAGGWTEGMGGSAGNMVANIMNTVNAANEVFQSGIFTKGSQTLSIFRMADPIDKTQVVMIASLSSR
jgi:hypothetical protein